MRYKPEEEKPIKASLKRRKTCKFSDNGQHDFVEIVPDLMKPYYPTIDKWIEHQKNSPLQRIFNSIWHNYKCSKCGKLKDKHESL